MVKILSIENTDYIHYNKTKNVYHVKISSKIDGQRIYKTLATGRTLIEALMMRDWIFSNGGKRFVPRHRYIQKQRNGWYHVYKDFREGNSYRREHYGSYSTLEKAIEERDLLIKYNWDLDLLCSME